MIEGHAVSTLRREDDERLYIYAIVPSSTVLPGAEGDRGLRSVPFGDLAAVVGPLTAAMTSVAGMELHDPIDDSLIGELGPAASEHELVVGRLLGIAPAMVPLRFGTVAPDEAGVRRLLEASGDTLRDALLLARGRAEWSVRIFVDPSVLSPSGGIPVTDDGHERAPGRAYLVAKRRERAEQTSKAVQLLATIAAIDEELAASSVAAAGLQSFERPKAGRLGTPQLVSRCVYLVERAREEAFLEALESAIARLGKGCFEAEVTGPWPAYHFVGQLAARALAPVDGPASPGAPGPDDGADEW